MDKRCETPGLLDLRFRLQGFALNSEQQAVWFNQGQTSDSGSPRCDEVQIILHSAQTPYSSLDTLHAFLHRDASCRINIPTQWLNDSVYLEVLHRNCVATWTSHPIELQEVTSLDLRNPLIVYGGNLGLDASGFASMYSGDINQDGVIDGLDYNDWETDNNNFGSGYLSTDLNGDGIVDGLDFLFWEVNNNNFVGVVRP